MDFTVQPPNPDGTFPSDPIPPERFLENIQRTLSMTGDTELIDVVGHGASRQAIFRVVVSTPEIFTEHKHEWMLVNPYTSRSVCTICGVLSQQGKSSDVY